MKKVEREARQRARQRQQNIRAVLFVGITLVILSLAGFPLKSAFFKPDPRP